MLKNIRIFCLLVLLTFFLPPALLHAQDVSDDTCDDCVEETFSHLELIYLSFTGSLFAPINSPWEAFLAELSAATSIVDAVMASRPCLGDCTTTDSYRSQTFIQLNGSFDPFDPVCGQTIKKKYTLSAWGLTCDIAQVVLGLQASSILTTANTVCQEETGSSECNASQVNHDFNTNSGPLLDFDEKGWGCTVTATINLDAVCAKGTASPSGGGTINGTIEAKRICSATADDDEDDEEEEAECGNGILEAGEVCDSDSDCTVGGFPRCFACQTCGNADPPLIPLY